MKPAFTLVTALLLAPLAALHTAEPPAQPMVPQDTESLGKLLCERIVMTSTGLETARKLAETGRYGAALEAWRDWKVRELRKLNPGLYGWHDDQRSSKYVDFAEVLVGRMDPKAARQPTARAEFADFYGLRGPVDQPLKTDWLAKDSAGAYSDNYRSFQMFNGLPARYWQSEDPVYLRKWFQIAGDFASKQKRAVENLGEKDRRKVPCNWLARDAAGMLLQGARVENLVRSMTVLCKSLPGSGKPAPWDAIDRPVEAPVPQASVALVPAGELAQVALSLVEDHPPGLLERYEPVGAVPNQRMTGLAAVLMIAAAFPEFKASPALLAKAGGGVDAFLEEAFHADGGMLEQSFNYNFGSARNISQIAGWMRLSAPDFAARLDRRAEGFYRLAAALATPLGRLPGMSSYAAANPPPVWRDARIRAKWMSEQREDLEAFADPLVAAVAAQFHEPALSPPPAFGSVAFPFSGYYVQRLNWRWDSPYLFLQGSRRARGHSTMGCNSIQVTAFGRPLLVMAGPPPYTAEHLPVELRGDYREIEDFLGERSSWKANTVLVDGNSQNAAAPMAQTAPHDPIPARWHVSPRFDLAEGFYDEGYPQKGVSHRRQVVFVREPGFWIVTDILVNSDQREHRFTQVWNLPGRRDDARNPACGFSNEDVVLDPAGRGFHTADADGPNVWLAHCGGGGLNYEKHFGEKNPYRGWFSPGIGGMVPAPQVLVDWKSPRSSVLVTVIWPAPDHRPPGFKLRDTSPADVRDQAGLVMDLPDGTTLKYQAAAGSRAMNTGDLAMTAQALLTVRSPDGNVQGLALGRQGADPEDCEFCWDGKEATDIIPIVHPRGFHWRETSAGWQPDYARENERKPESK